jgi:hypothetical protein
MHDKSYLLIRLINIIKRKNLIISLNTVLLVLLVLLSKVFDFLSTILAILFSKIPALYFVLFSHRR